MKKIGQIFLFSLTAVQICLAQNFTGKWAGELTQNGKPDIFTYEIELVQQDNKVGGFAHSRNKDGITAKFELGGLWDGSMLALQEVQQLEPPNARWCLKHIRLRYSESATGDQLEGPWEAQGCTPGNLLLRKQATSETLERSVALSPLIPHPSSLSATIRLHQLKFFEKTGIPPVDRGMLMFYNMGDLEAWETENSILDPAAGKKYLTPDARYPLPLDFALPLFRWGVLFRDGQLFKLINNLGEKDLQDTLRFTPITSGRFLVKKSTYLQGYYLYEDDLIRLESVKTGQLEAAAALLGKMFPPAERTVGFYHLDSGLVRGFPAKNLEKVLEKIK